MAAKLGKSQAAAASGPSTPLILCIVCLLCCSVLSVVLYFIGIRASKVFNACAAAQPDCQACLDAKRPDCFDKECAKCR